VSSIIVIVMVILAILVIPLICFSYLQRRGQKRWAFFTLVTGLIGLGWVVGLIGVIIASANPAVDYDLLDEHPTLKTRHEIYIASPEEGQRHVANRF
jgi:hypothetical protein